MQVHILPSLSSIVHTKSGIWIHPKFPHPELCLNHTHKDYYLATVYTGCIDLCVSVCVHVFGVCTQLEIRGDEMRSQGDEKLSAINQCQALIFPVMSSQNV